MARMLDSSDSQGVYEHRVPVTVVGCLYGSCFILGSIALVLQKDTFIAKRKAFQYMVLSVLGLIFYLRDSIEIAWTYPEYNYTTRVTYLYFLIGVPFHFIPVMVRSWRIICVYRSTPTWNCKMESIASRRRRGHAWMLVRMFVLYIPYVIIAFGLIVDPDIPYYTYIGLNGLYAIVNFMETLFLYNMRTELRQKYLDETSSLLVYSCLSLLEWIFANTMYILAYLVDTDGILVYHLYIDMTLIASMWFMTTGRTLYRVWMKRDITGDKKPELGDQDIQKAMQRVAVQGSSALSHSELSTSEELESDVGKV